MGRYLTLRILRGLVSAVIVVGVVMVLVYGLLDRNLIFATDPAFVRQKSNAKEVYKLQRWEDYGYVDYVSYGEFLRSLLQDGEISQEDYAQAAVIGDTASEDSALTARYAERFNDRYTAKGYTVTRLDARLRGSSGKYQEGGEPRLYAHRDIPVIRRLWEYLSGIVTVEDVHYAETVRGERGIRFTWNDPAYGGDRFAPAIMGNGTKHRYLLYFDDRFPYLHQNLIDIDLGISYSIDQGVDVHDTLTQSQGAREVTEVVYPSGKVEQSADDLHSATYVSGSYESGDPVVEERFVDDYTAVTTRKQGLSKLGYSFTIGLSSVVLAYLLAIPLGIYMARHHGRLADRLGTVYIVAIMAVPTLAYIFLFRAVGEGLGLPAAFDVEHPQARMYVLPVISLGLPAAANLMKWLRRYTIDQMDAEYVRFARSSGLGEGKIFRSHVLKNAAIPIVHGIPAMILGSLVGAIITERVYVVPGAGGLLTEAIGAYDNGVIVGMTLFYAVLSVASVILGDILIGIVDPRIDLRG